MRLFLTSRLRPDVAYEVLSYDQAGHRAELRGRDGIVTDPNFHLEIVKRCFMLSETEPACLRRSNRES